MNARLEIRQKADLFGANTSANSCTFEKDKKTSWINDLFILRRRLHLQQLKEWRVLT